MLRTFCAKISGWKNLLRAIAPTIGGKQLLKPHADEGPRNIICSYPRSGNHLVRFFVELLTELPTSGCTGSKTDIPVYQNSFPEKVPFNIQDENSYSYYKEHKIPPFESIGKLIFILRNPREVLLRHNNYEMNLKSFDIYFQNIDGFLGFGGEKLLLYYEDILSDRKGFIEQLYAFLDVNNEKKLRYTLQNVDQLYDISAQGKKRGWGGVNSNFELEFYYKNPKNIHKSDFDRYLNNKLKDQKYAFVSQKYGIPPPD